MSLEKGIRIDAVVLEHDSFHRRIFEHLVDKGVLVLSDSGEGGENISKISVFRSPP